MQRDMNENCLYLFGYNIKCFITQGDTKNVIH